MSERETITSIELEDLDADEVASDEIKGGVTSRKAGGTQQEY